VQSSDQSNQLHEPEKKVIAPVMEVIDVDGPLQVESIQLEDA